MTTELEECHEYALRVALLQEAIDKRLEQRAHLMQEAANAAQKAQESLASFSLDLGSLIGRDASKSPRYPEKYIKTLDGILQKVAMGQDSKFSEQRFRRAVAFFWSSSWADKTFQRQLKESRKLEDIILAFVSAATKSLRKEHDLADGGWKAELNPQILMFLDLLHDSLSSVGSGAAELRARLSTYRSRLQSDNTSNSSSTPTVGTMPDDNRPTARSAFELDVVLKVLPVDSAKLAEAVEMLRGGCSVEAALEDLKILTQRLESGNEVPYDREEFADDRAWSDFQGRERSALLELSRELRNLEFTKDRSGDRSEVNGITAALDNTGFDARHLFYLPRDARQTYRQLLRVCLDYDLQVLRTLPEDQDVSLSILSAEHTEFLNECANRWRLPQSFRSWVFLEAIQEHYEHGEVPPDCVFEAVGGVGRASQELAVSEWPVSDQSGLQAVLLRRNTFFLNDVEVALTSPKGYLSPEFRQAVSQWQLLEASDEDHVVLQRIQRAICDRLRQQAYTNYIDEASEMYAREGGKNRQFALALASWIESGAKRLDKWFPDPISAQVDVVSLVLHQHLSLWIRDLEEAMLSVGSNDSENHLEEALEIYQRAQKLQDMGTAFGMESSQLVLSTIFGPIVSAWLDSTEVKMRQWVDQALQLDDFAPVSPNSHSSSVTDLFDSFHSAISFLLGLRWDDPEQMATFATRLAKMISLSIDDYCTKMEQLFASDMQESESHASSAKQQAWIEKAKSTIAHLQGDRKLQAFFNFTPESCVKLNNIDAMRHQLDRLYLDMRVDEFASLDVNQPVSASTGQSSLFTIKIVLGEGLQVDGGAKAPDSFVVLSDEHGNRYAKTRTIYDDFDPRWDETFDIAIRQPSWFMVTVRHRNLSGKHDLVGRAYLRLDPSQYVDFISKDVLLPLNTKGHVLLRVSMEGERDDIQFHFGRAFRWLKRTESDMVRLFVDKMTPVLRHTLSRNNIKSVLKPNTGIDYNDALRISNDAIGRISAAYRNAVSAAQGDYSIPLPPSEVQPAKQQSAALKRGPTEAEIEAAIHPLFDYLDTNNHTLASTLSPDAMQMVMAKLWKQILTTIEALIVPPLSDKPSQMRALSHSELDIALRWLKFLRDFFFAGGDDSGVPLNILQNAKFNEIMSVSMYYDWSTDELMEECIRGFQNTLKHKAMKPSKSIIGQRNLGTIRARKTAKRTMNQKSGEDRTELIMKILRMRDGTQEFLAQQIQTLNAVKLESTGKQSRRKGQGKHM